MARILKALGLSPIAVFAVSAAIASDAGAAEFTAFDTSTKKHESSTYSGSGKGAKFEVTSGAFEVECEEESYSGSSATSTETTPKVTPKYGKCTAKIGKSSFEAKIRTNKCEYQAHIDKEVEKEKEYTGHVSIVGCEKGKGIEIEVPATGCIDTIDEVGNQNLEQATFKITFSFTPQSCRSDPACGARPGNPGLGSSWDPPG
jgi:hypothetical protein